MLKTEGIVLSELRYKETSKILKVYTKKVGKISVMAQGAYRPKSKVTASTQSFSYSEYQLQEGRSFYYLSEGDIIDSFYSIRDNMERIVYGFYMLELIDKSTPDEEENEKLFLLLEKGLRILSGLEKDYLKFIVSYELKYISFLGYRPFLSSCVICNSPTGQRIKFSISNGGIICESCFSHDYTSKNIDYPLLSAMNDLIFTSLDDLDKIRVSESTLISLHKLLVDYILYNIDRSEFKSLDILNSLVAK